MFIFLIKIAAQFKVFCHFFVNHFGTKQYAIITTSTFDNPPKVYPFDIQMDTYNLLKKSALGSYHTSDIRRWSSSFYVSPNDVNFLNKRRKEEKNAEKEEIKIEPLKVRDIREVSIDETVIDLTPVSFVVDPNDFLKIE
ncbi:hypothetical protein TVAG_088810 [Trichomonas vaginalis G3]|uniref:Uncharacterized protein n=1 Tax=Trichomonas vaginalis (strain ATCC PRA-98 / G3) TaxID=412133 RepID=A2EB26_TRIV3|nr:hypothetical protein TVAGG3_0397780 [Trichomonas vaginalis G3]EAY10166.1 hypothetical protein TVAG_088810 [Trichomonas vaginalis G3]KAI5534459.1 hypothetical protein TVAGG3_0397780 [Trichomonas vaginalis G3]|eukprot:XP_001322389.1 hypothetical protein [Trichomonas vaginalis G3]